MAIDLVDLGRTECGSESDVEQKIVLPLLTATEWLRIPANAVHTKHYLPPTTIDKGRKSKGGYYPDYSVWVDGLPVFIVEVKSPNESAEEGLREAQLYAHEINKVYPPGVNPVRFVLSLNGHKLLYGEWDSALHTEVPTADLKLSSGSSTALRSFLGIDALLRHVARVRGSFRLTNVFRPIDSIGGEQLLNRRLEFNSFATELADLIRMFFVSDEAERIDDIIERAYVSSSEITKYDQLLEGFLRDTIRRVQDPSSKEIETTSNSEGLLTPEIRAFYKKRPTTGHLQLLIGPVGAGKSLFCQRYHRHLQPKDVTEATHWSFIDINKAPEDLDKLEEWVCEYFIEGFEADNSRVDLYEPDTIRRIFDPDINRLEKIYQALAPMTGTPSIRRWKRKFNDGLRTPLNSRLLQRATSAVIGVRLSLWSSTTWTAEIVSSS